VVDAEEVQDRGVDGRDRDGVDDLLVADFLGLAVAGPASDADAGHQGERRGAG